jgi:hypothetical protein
MEITTREGIRIINQGRCDRMDMTREIVVYLEDAPRRGGSGAHLRFFSNLRALSDAGFVIHLVRFVLPNAAPWHDDNELRIASDTQVPIDSQVNVQHSIAARIMYRSGIPTRSAVRMYFSIARQVEEAISRMAVLHPNAVHFMEGEPLAAAAMHTNVDWIWSEHERIGASVTQLHHGLAPDVQTLQRRRLARERKFATAVEREIIRRSAGNVFISANTSKWAIDEKAHADGVFLPTSIFEDNEMWPARPLIPADEFVSFLHLGSISHLPSYTSLQFLLGEVFPHIPLALLSQFRLTIVGTANGALPRAQEILALAAKYPNVVVAGFADDLEPVYGVHHAQIVATTQGAGIRTRVVESFARGMPLIATAKAVDGLEGVTPGVHFGLLPDNPVEAAHSIASFVIKKSSQEQLRCAARTLYEQTCGRAAVKRIIGDYMRPLTTKKRA